MLKIGLTGGIGCGKTTVCQLFADLGVPIIDADLIARQVVVPGSPLLDTLSTTFGTSIILSNGELDRAALRDRIFTSETARQQLNAIMHPAIYSVIAHNIQNLSGQYCIVAVPLLLETGQQHHMDRVLVVDCDIQTQIIRVKQRDKLKDQQIQSIINSQISRPQRLALADDIIDNSATSEKLAEQVKRLHNSYNFLANLRTPSA